MSCGMDSGRQASQLRRVVRCLPVHPEDLIHDHMPSRVQRADRCRPVDHLVDNLADESFIDEACPEADEFQPVGQHVLAVFRVVTVIQPLLDRVILDFRTSSYSRKRVE